MKVISKFIKKNVLIFIFFLISVIVIISYICTINLPELFAGAGHWYNLLFQLAIGYIINFMFYITQVYLPNNKRAETVHRCICVRLNQITQDMRSSILRLGEIYLKNHSGDNYCEEELKQLRVLRFSDKVNVCDAKRTTTNSTEYFTVREWMIECIKRTESGIDNLFKYYANDISVDLMSSLEEVLKSNYHTLMKTLLLLPTDVNLSGDDDIFFISYYHLICRLEEIKQKDYD